MRRIIIFLKTIFIMPLRLFSKISPFSIIQDSIIDKKAAICSGSKFYRSSIGKYSYIGRNCFVTNTEIGKFCSLGENCYIGGTMHPVHWVSTSPVFHKWDNILNKNFSHFEFEIFKDTIIGNDVWIGVNVLIRSGLTISDGVIIGMGSVVTKDIGPYEIWAGNPAKFIKKRFDDETIRKLLLDRWWECDDEEISNKAKYFNDLNCYLK